MIGYFVVAFHPAEVIYDCFTPTWLRHQYTNPEQSNSSGPFAPRTYLHPSLLFATAISSSTLDESAACVASVPVGFVVVEVLSLFVVPVELPDEEVVPVELPDVPVVPDDELLVLVLASVVFVVVAVCFCCDFCHSVFETALSENRSSMVLVPTFPSMESPFACWKLLMALSVASPKYPVSPVMYLRSTSIVEISPAP